MRENFTMDNLQAVSEELARFNFMRLVPLEELLNTQQEDMATSGNERHYIKWAKEATNAEGRKVAGNARVSSPRDGTGNVWIAIISMSASRPTPEEVRIVQEYINTKRPVGANPVVSAAEDITGGDCLCNPAKIRPQRRDGEAENKGEHPGVSAGNCFPENQMVLNYYRISNILGDADGVERNWWS